MSRLPPKNKPVNILGLTKQKFKQRVQRKGFFVRYPIDDNIKGLRGEVLLGRSILDIALMDAVRNKEKHYGWFNPSSEDFQLICDIAEMEPELVMERFLKMFVLLTPQTRTAKINKSTRKKPS